MYYSTNLSTCFVQLPSHHAFLVSSSEGDSSEFRVVCKFVSKILKLSFLSRHLYEVCSKSKVTFQISRATYFRLSIFFFCYVGTLFPNICTKFQVYSIFCLVVRGVKVISVLRARRFFAIEKYGSKDLHQILCKK